MKQKKLNHRDYLLIIVVGCIVLVFLPTSENVGAFFIIIALVAWISFWASCLTNCGLNKKYVWWALIFLVGIVFAPLYHFINKHQDKKLEK